MMKKVIFIFLILFTTTLSKSQIITDSVLVEDHFRVFHFNKSISNIEDSHLIFALHGSGGDGLGMIPPANNLEKIAEKEKILLVYPDGYKKYWNECRKASNSAANLEDINEQAFLDAMIDYFQKNYAVKTNQFFAIGFSGGGHMAYKLALTMPDKCKAISVITANLPDTNNFDCVAMKIPVAALIMNGTKDPINPYNGGEMMVNGSSFGHVLSAENSFAYWSQLAGYKGEPTIAELSDPDATNQQTITRYTYKEKYRPEVTFLKVVGGEHSFPKDIDAFLESWEFFKRVKE